MASADMSDVAAMDSFVAAFDRTPETVAAAPGRVNLIGEHIDYNGGMVLPAALKQKTCVSLAARDDDFVRISTDRYDDIALRRLNEIASGHWSDHALGAICAAYENNLLQGGADLYVESDVPDGAGLSSSAALIVATLKAAREVWKRNGDAAKALSDVDIALLAQKVENDFIGVPCGVMDQMATALGVSDRAMALDTKTLRYELVSLPDACQLIVIHSGVTRQLSDGRYGARKAECDAARDLFSVRDICMLEPKLILEKPDIDPVIRRRALHCAREHRRVIAAVDALRANDVSALGGLLYESHVSMRDDFEMSTPEIDALIEDARNLGAIGARLTGGGFGGCIVALVDRDISERLSQSLLARHPAAWFVSST